MSLTSYLSDPDYFELRDQFKIHFPRPPFELKGEVKAPPLTKNYGIIGTAFDYLLRFRIQKHNKTNCILNEYWVADHSFVGLVKCIDEKRKTDLLYRFDRSKQNYRQFLRTGKVSNELFADTLFLAKLDLYFRSGLIASDLFEENALDIQDLNNLNSAINIKLFKANNAVYLNPTFGKGSMIVGGADADIILDDTLIDIKVTKHLKLEREYLNQTIGYCILALIGGINHNPKAKAIKNIGIYFARYGLLWTVPLKDLCDSKKMKAFKEWFLGYFEEVKADRLIEIRQEIQALKIKIERENKISKKKSV